MTPASRLGLLLAAGGLTLAAIYLVAPFGGPVTSLDAALVGALGLAQAWIMRRRPTR